MHTLYFYTLLSPTQLKHGDWVYINNKMAGGGRQESRRDLQKTGANRLERNAAGRNPNLQHRLQKRVWHMAARPVL
ncbi:hypothetical protein B0J14DRAFT_602337 [Halenospora varia]|nr:hypothetical protein B0J14DRAFT_602337 [Halenospora varia]